DKPQGQNRGNGKAKRQFSAPKEGNNDSTNKGKRPNTKGSKPANNANGKTHGKPSHAKPNSVKTGNSKPANGKPSAQRRKPRPQSA
ncbi:TPA: ATP-dependent helicase, partial [Vibrio vulnificus]|nr:ATP-dependent helicase [Vibrio vulnificus]